MGLLSRQGRAAVEPGSGYSLLDSQLTVTGDIETTGSLRIDGRLKGNIRNADTVVVGVGASMTGDLHAREVIIGGSLSGNVSATERVELQPTGIVVGNVNTQVVLVHEGGVVNGRIEMRPAGTAGTARDAEREGELSLPHGRH